MYTSGAALPAHAGAKEAARPSAEQALITPNAPVPHPRFVPPPLLRAPASGPRASRCTAQAPPKQPASRPSLLWKHGEPTLQR